MVLMTDGENTTEIVQDSVVESEYRAPPYISNAAANETSTIANAATKRMCENAKKSDIEIYTIAFKVSDATKKSLLKNCASSPDKALTADSNTALVQTFETVAKSVEADIRLMR